MTERAMDLEVGLPDSSPLVHHGNFHAISQSLGGMPGQCSCQ